MTTSIEPTQDTTDEVNQTSSPAEAHACHALRDPRRPLDCRWQRATQLVRRKQTPDAEWDDKATHAAFGLLTDPDDSPEQLKEALQIYSDGMLPRWELEARILANRNVDETAKQLAMPVEVVAAYE